MNLDTFWSTVLSFKHGDIAVYMHSGHFFEGRIASNTGAAVTCISNRVGGQIVTFAVGDVIAVGGRHPRSKTA